MCIYICVCVPFCSQETLNFTRDLPFLAVSIPIPSSQKSACKVSKSRIALIGWRSSSPSSSCHRRIQHGNWWQDVLFLEWKITDI